MLQLCGFTPRKQCGGKTVEWWWAPASAAWDNLAVSRSVVRMDFSTPYNLNEKIELVHSYERLASSVLCIFYGGWWRSVIRYNNFIKISAFDHIKQAFLRLYVNDLKNTVASGTSTATVGMLWEWNKEIRFVCLFICWKHLDLFCHSEGALQIQCDGSADMLEFGGE